MKFYITQDGWFYKELWEELGKALWVSEKEKATVYDNYDVAFRTACEVQAVTESAVNVAVVG